LESEEIIIGSLRAMGEPLSIVSEEAGTLDINGGGRLVIIDPIDGSKNAISGVPFYCLSIALAEDDKVGSMSAGYIMNLLTGDEFWAEKGKGAFFNGEPISCQKDDVYYFVAYEAQSSRGDLRRILPLLDAARKGRCFGALALDLAYVAYGALSVLAGPARARVFDFAAGYLLVNEAGGVVSDIEGNCIDNVKISLHDRVSLLAAGNRKLHDNALGLLNG
jgi:myo-inositol-1(or 4)-monophosphatase